MNEEQIADTMRSFVKDMASGNVEKTLAYFTDNAVYTNPYGTSTGRSAIKEELGGMSRNMKDMKVVETGNGVIVSGQRAFYEHVISGTYRGKKFEMLAMCAYEFNGDKIQNLRSVYDRLLVAQETVSGWPAKSMVDTVVRQSEKAMK
jgi:ketosteroid isomerase-like protein